MACGVRAWRGPGCNSVVAAACSTMQVPGTGKGGVGRTPAAFGTVHKADTWDLKAGSVRATKLIPRWQLNAKLKGELLAQE